MATHQLSVITNSCFRPPVDPKTGLSCATEKGKDRETAENYTEKEWGHSTDLPENSKPHYDEQVSRSVNFDTTSTMIDTMQGIDAELSQLSDDEFYKKLSSLKSEHKKTLELCELLYHEKLAEKDQRTGAGPTLNSRHMPIASVDADYSLSSHHPLNTQSGSFNQSVAFLKGNSAYPKDSVKDLSSKPPVGRPRSSSASPDRSTWQRKYRRNDPAQYWRTSGSASSDTEYSEEEISTWSRASARQLQYPEESAATIQDDSQTASRIDQMWDDFAIDDYAPRTQKQKSTPISSKAKQEKDAANTELAKAWKNKITVPKPFNMTLREAKKPQKKAEKAMEIERLREEKQRQEEAECQKQFKAKPVPAHVYMPLYDEFMEASEERRRFIRQHCSELVQSMVKPFKFDHREAEKRKKQVQALQEGVKETQKKPPTGFKANPFPAHLFDESTNDKIQEEEEYRRIRIQMRSQELLHSSSKPGNMEMREKIYGPSGSKQKIQSARARKAGIIVDYDHQPRINDTVPDFEELHDQFMREASRRKQMKEATVCKPFKFNAARLSQKQRIYEDILRDEETLRENRWPYKNPRSGFLSRSINGSLSTSMDSIPTKMTASADLRSKAIKEKLESRAIEDIKKAEEERRRHRKERELKRVIADKAAANDVTSSMKQATEQKLREYRASERARQHEYQRQLKEIQDRVRSRPLLFEQTVQTNARQKAERRYRDTLHSAGVDEDFVRKKGSLASEGLPDQSFDPRDEDSRSFDEPLSSKHYSTGTGSQRYTQDFEPTGSAASDEERTSAEEVSDMDPEADYTD